MTDEVLWTAAEAAEATGGTASGDWNATGVSIDSRTCELGDLFVALVGDTNDGHAYVAAALAKGAAAAMVLTTYSGEPQYAGRLLRVADTMAGLNALGRASRVRSTARIIAVTGSVGKTSTKEALRLALSRFKPTHASALSYNNQWGVPLSLARMPRSAAFGVFELGMNHPGELDPLTRLVRPHVALITTVAEVHTAFFHSVEEIADAKAEIFMGLEPDGIAVLNRDNTHFDRLAAKAKACGAARIISFGEDTRSDVRVVKFHLHDACSCVTADVCGQIVTYKVGIAGRHWVGNSLAVMAGVSALGGDLGLAGLALGDLSPLKGRGQRHKIETRDGEFTLIDESYNASPVAMRAAIATLANVAKPDHARRIAVLGDMLELGPKSPEIHAGLAKDLVEAKIDLVFCAGPNMRVLSEALPRAMRGGAEDNSLDLAPLVARAIRPGDVVMVKGSLGSRMARVVDALLDLGARTPSRAANG
jgi:UDP-N-acetylmuramoyl-tripeptide--D-alanyl-D-alanine ligase